MAEGADVGGVVPAAGGTLLEGEPVKRNEIGAADALAPEGAVQRCGGLCGVGGPISEPGRAVPPEEVVQGTAEHAGE